jgi:hypothetical protein
VIALPMAALQGIYLIFVADIWSLVYRELPRRPSLPPIALPAEIGPPPVAAQP